ncbi:LPS export ABC transporter ATP-binding protein [Geoalkalibacter halelectricus]|uniref:Lipopolysaccharide export system ATP-binding protein LptB n=1 Tax=Geoalkalibacter halelectricus TaxID=2847045 RepID=A0ABY5ZLR2_9BACT|nr:LPS export ABC transporter ATP-binding protein [Geoalkalibacter halelectricus]MDO3379377.1 LPS export ABC transporter ATP-binding protein [Geoalkalibacter halelectricus]UWZ78745.1 LPS export ABC transporter ATP-binding protein [Geoalkalibacter halelectricus]
MSHLLKAQGLCKSYKGRQVVREVDLELRTGQVIGLLGPNGAGKTTSFYMVVGLTRPDQGRIFFDTQDITDWPMYLRARSGISYLPQEPSVFRKMTVEGNLLAILETLGLPAGERRSRCDQLLEEFGITHIARSQGYALSGGERRRVEIARALVLDPAFILLDEPFAGIDPIAVIDIQKTISHLVARGIGVLISDHNVRETLGVCDMAYILSEGRILEYGTPAEIAASPRARKVYLGEGFSL